MKKILIGILLFPLVIFAVGVTLVFVGKGLNIFKGPDSQMITSTETPEAQKRSVPATSSPLPAQITKPAITYATKYYAVSGSTKEEIRASMVAARKGTFLEGHSAATTAEVHIRFSRRQLAAVCEAALKQFDLTITYTYPQWTPAPGTSADVIAQWNTLLAGLTIHEEGHAKIEADRAVVIMEELKKLPRSATCDAFDTAWKQKVEMLDQESKQIEAQYDRDTQSGKTQGAIF